MRKVEDQITVLKNEKFSELVRPCDAFITFEEEDGGIIAQEFEAEFTLSGKREASKRDFMGDELFLIESTEPTNIIWENRHFTAQDYLKRTATVLVIIFFLIMTSFICIFMCKMYAITKSNKYPDVNCVDIKETYSAGDATVYESYAYREWIGYYGGENTTSEVSAPLSGVLQCYCIEK